MYSATCLYWSTVSCSRHWRPADFSTSFRLMVGDIQSPSPTIAGRYSQTRSQVNDLAALALLEALSAAWNTVPADKSTLHPGMINFWAAVSVSSDFSATHHLNSISQRGTSPNCSNALLRCVSFTIRDKQCRHMCLLLPPA